MCWVNALWAYEQGRWSVGTGWTWGQTRPYWLCPHWRWVQQTSRSHVERRQTWTRIRQSTAQERARTLQKPDQWPNTHMCPLLLAAPWKTQTQSQWCWAIRAEQNKREHDAWRQCSTYCNRPLDSLFGVTSSLPWLCEKQTTAKHTVRTETGKRVCYKARLMA